MAPGDPPDGGETLQLPEGRGAPKVRQFTIRVVEGLDVGQSFESQAERTIIGTHEKADLILTDPTVSRFHCEIRSVDGALILRDLGSRNGVVIDGVRVLEAHVRSQANVVLGQTKLLFEMGAASLAMPASDRERFGLLVGRSVAMRRVFALLERAAQTAATVLLEGETGTGKEATAESIHRESERHDRPFIVVDCAAIPADLIESELFGHERGAFTGAVASREGAFEAAHTGTIFLDEIGELSSDLQPKLLRVLERREIKRVGNSRYLPVDVRVIAATNRNLRGDVNARRFRSDLYYRLAVIEITLPALRDRPDDIPLLVENLLGAMDMADKPEAAVVRRAELQRDLARHTWPGNVRELRNYIERCLALVDNPPLQATDAAASGGGPILDTRRPLKESREQWLAAFERRYLAQILDEHEGNVRNAARAAGIDRIHFYRLLWKHGLK